MSKTNVLIFPAGEINSVELHDALSHNVNVELFGCSSQDRHGGYIFKNYKSGIPNIMDDNFLEKFNELIEDWNIDFIFPKVNKMPKGQYRCICNFFVRNNKYGSPLELKINFV